MSYYVIVSSDTRYQPNPWRWLIVAIGALILCSCQSVEKMDQREGFIAGDAPTDNRSLVERTIIADPQSGDQHQVYGSNTFRMADRPAPVADARGAMTTSDDGFEYVEDGSDSSYNQPLDESYLRRDDSEAMPGPCTCSTCRPNAHQRWGQPNDEYVCDGADSAGRVVVRKDFSIKAGLDPSDTVAHFDTIDGKTEVQASTKTCIYAPRFAAARKVVRVETRNSIVRATPVTARESTIARRDNMEAGHVKLPEAVHQQIDNTIGMRLHQNEPTRLRENVVGLELAQARLLPFENLEIVRTGTFDQRDTTLFEEAAEAAIVWSGIEEIQVTIQGMPAHESQANFGGQEVLLYEVRPGSSELRLLKLASKCAANSGDKVHFTIRFDNTGDEPIGNVTILDNLPARLQLVESTADCSVKHDFLSYPNDVGSDTLRFEITNPLEPGEGGVIRFQCVLR